MRTLNEKLEKHLKNMAKSAEKSAIKFYPCERRFPQYVSFHEPRASQSQGGYTTLAKLYEMETRVLNQSVSRKISNDHQSINLKVSINI